MWPRIETARHWDGPLYSLVVDSLTGIATQARDATIAVATSPSGRRDHLRDKLGLILTTAWDLALRRPA